MVLFVLAVQSILVFNPGYNHQQGPVKDKHKFPQAIIVRHKYNSRFLLNSQLAAGPPYFFQPWAVGSLLSLR